MRGVVLGRRPEVGVATGLAIVEPNAVGIVKVVVLDGEVLVGEDVRERVELRQVEEASLGDQRADDR